MSLPPVVFEDDVLIAFDKPAGVPVVAGARDKNRESLLPLVRAKFGDAAAGVHRLDTETSGLFLCAKTKPALDFLSGQFQSKTVGKKYLALVATLPGDHQSKPAVLARDTTGALLDTFTIDLPLGEDEREKGRMVVVKGRGGKESVTVVHVLERFGRFTLLECQPITGRPHQVRVHLAAIGAPLLNDALYGNPGIKLLLSELKPRYKGREEEKPLLNGLTLHSSKLVLTHPTSKEPLVLEAPLPHEWNVALKYLRKFNSNRR